MCIKKIIVACVLIISLFAATTKVIADPLETIVDLTPQKQVEYFSVIYGANSHLVSMVIENESKWIHDFNKCVDGGRSCGIAQIQEPTFKWLLGLYNKQYTEELNYKSQFDQIKLTTWAIANGYGRNWTAYRCIKNGGTYSFWSSQLQKHFSVTCKL